MTNSHTTNLEVDGLHWATSEPVIEKTLSGSTVIVTINALLLKRLRLPAQQAPGAAQRTVQEPEPTAPVPAGTR